MKFFSARIDATWDTAVDVARENGIAWDQVLNATTGWWKVLIAAVTGERQQPAYSDETMSARIFRSARRGRIVGRYLMPVVDAAFSLWQRDEQGRRIKNHCARAYQKEVERRNLPPEYRQNKEQA